MMDWKLLIAPLFALVGVWIGTRTTARVAEESAKRARQSLEQDREDQLHEDVAAWALLEHNWAGTLAGGYKADHPEVHHPGHSERLMMQVELRASPAVVAAYMRFHMTVLNFRDVVDYDSLQEPPDTVPRLVLPSEAPSTAAHLEMRDALGELIDVLRAAEGNAPLPPQSPPVALRSSD